MKTDTQASHRPRFVTVKQAAEMLVVSQKTIYRLLQRSHLKASPHLRRKLIPISSIEQFEHSANN